MSTVVPISRVVEQALERNGFAVMAGACSFRRRLQHRHSGLELSLVYSGVAEIFVGTSAVTLLPGDAVIHPADIEHGSRGAFNRTVVHFISDMVPRDLEHVAAEIAASGCCLAFRPTAHQTRRMLWAAYELSQAATERGSRLVAKSLIGVLLADAQGALLHGARPGMTCLLRDIMAYMHSHPDGSETLASVARRFGISRSHMTELFRSQVGISPGAYWLKVRLEHAARLLEEDCTVEEVARRSGFQSARGLQRAFRRVYKMTPSEYRTLASRRMTVSNRRSGQIVAPQVDWSQDSTVGDGECRG